MPKLMGPGYVFHGPATCPERQPYMSKTINWKGWYPHA